jgi:glutamate dehydrogenase/leucine dehydrogenase
VLADRGILYVPDFLANVGGIIYLIEREVDGRTEMDVERRLDGIEANATEVLLRARDESVTPLQAARQVALERLAQLSPTGSAIPG